MATNTEPTRAYTPTTHSNTVGGSTAARVMACPASLKLSRKAPPQAESDYAAEGTALHECIEYCLFNDVTPEAATDLIGQAFYGVEMTADQINEAIIPALKMFDGLWAELEEQDGEVTEYAIEQTVAFPDIPDAFGIADIILRTPKRTVIYDWKFGRNSVSAHENIQLMFYARAAAYSAERLFWPNSGPEVGVERPHEWPVELVICQPRVRDELSRYTIQFAELEVFRRELISAVNEALHAHEPSFKRGDHCRWCPAAPMCPSFAVAGDALQRLAGGHASELQAATPDNAPTPMYDPQDMADWLRKADEIEHWIRAVRKAAHDQAELGNPPAGMKLVARLGNTRWALPEDKVASMLARRGLPAKERVVKKLISPTQALKKLKAMGKTLPEKMTERPETGHVLVPDSDKRPAVVPTAQCIKLTGEKLKSLVEKE